MFPLRWNFPFRKKDGSISTIDDAISEGGGGGGGYTLPTASAETKGGIKVGSGLTMNGETLNNSNPTPYSLPTASAETLGGVKVGSGLSITDGVLSASGGGGGSIPISDYDNPLSRMEISSTNISLTKPALVTLVGDEDSGALITINYGLPSEFKISVSPGNVMTLIMPSGITITDEYGNGKGYVVLFK